MNVVRPRTRRPGPRRSIRHGDVALAVPPMHPNLPVHIREQIYRLVLTRHYGEAYELAADENRVEARREDKREAVAYTPAERAWRADGRESVMRVARYILLRHRGDLDTVKRLGREYADSIDYSDKPMTVGEEFAAAGPAQQAEIMRDQADDKAFEIRRKDERHLARAAQMGQYVLDIAAAWYAADAA